MTARAVPQDGDVVVRKDRRDGTLVYVLRAARSVDQLIVRTRDEAVTQAVVFAKREQVRAWLMDERNGFTLLSTRDLAPDDALLNRIRGEFLEMPGLCLTRDQAQRLCGVERTLCQQVLDGLVAMGFLYVKPNGMYARLTDGGEAPRPHLAKANLRPARRSMTGQN
jgi:hypothetical protein